MNLANKITFFRILLVPFFIGFILYSKYNFALAIFITAIISDALDGFIARTFKQKTRLGTILDPLADKILLMSAFLCFAVVKGVGGFIDLPLYVPIVVISRDAILLMGSLLVYVVRGHIIVKPSYLGKITTFFQMLTVVLVLMQFKYLAAIWNVMVLFTVISFVHYIVIGSRMLDKKA